MEQYSSLYMYNGQASRVSGIGKQVYAAAKEQGINVIYETLPIEKQTKEYPSIATYPISFLDEYFEAKTEVELLTDRVTFLETRVEILLKNIDPKLTTIIVEADPDDLPF